MIATKVSADVLRRAAEKIGVEAEIETVNQKGTRHRVKLFPLVTEDHLCTKSGRRIEGEKGDAAYQRESTGYGTAGRRVNAVCWHGFRDYFRAVFAEAPEATFRTSLNTWRGSEDFEKRFLASGYKNIGPRIAPVSIVDACRCPDRGRAC